MPRALKSPGLRVADLEASHFTSLRYGNENGRGSGVLAAFESRFATTRSSLSGSREPTIGSSLDDADHPRGVFAAGRVVRSSTGSSVNEAAARILQPPTRQGGNAFYTPWLTGQALSGQARSPMCPDLADLV